MISGFSIAKWFNAIGINAFVLKYRLPHSPDLVERHLGPLQDAQRAIRYIRSHTKAWNISPHKVGIMGTSAGAHLASTVGTNVNDVSNTADTMGSIRFIPDFMVLVLPVITMLQYAHKGSRSQLLGNDPIAALMACISNELQVTKETSLAFIVHAANDNSVDVMNSVLFYQALCEYKVLSSLDIFPYEGHHISMNNNSGRTALWAELCKE